MLPFKAPYNNTPGELFLNVPPAHSSALQGAPWGGEDESGKEERAHGQFIKEASLYERPSLVDMTVVIHFQDTPRLVSFSIRNSPRLP